MFRGYLSFIILFLCACGKSEPAVPQQPLPAVGGLELPISSWNTGAASGMEIVMVPDAIFAGGAKAMDLVRGQVPAADRRSRGLAAMASVLDSAQRPSLTIVAHGAVGFGTLARVIESATLRGFSQFQIAVRTNSAMPPVRGYLPITQPQILVGANAEIPFSEPRRSFREVNDAWQAMFDACRGARYIDCDHVPATRPSDDGSFYMALFSRGTAMQMHLRRFGLPTPAAAPQPAQDLAVGQTGDQTHPLDMLQLSVDGATFSFRAEVAVQADNGISTAARTLCGARRCDVVIEGDEETPLMRILTLVGAAFPNGAQAPRIAIRVPS